MIREATVVLFFYSKKAVVITNAMYSVHILYVNSIQYIIIIIKSNLIRYVIPHEIDPLHGVQRVPVSLLRLCWDCEGHHRDHRASGAALQCQDHLGGHQPDGTGQVRGVGHEGRVMEELPVVW